MKAIDPCDFYDVASLLSDDERMVRDSVARLVDERVLPIIGNAFAEQRFPRELVLELAGLGLLGSSLQGYGCAGLNAISYGLICQELERGDSGLRSFVSVQSSLCMYPIYVYGSEAQRQRFLPGMATGEIVGCFGLTEPHGGSDPANMKTHARRRGTDWVLNGSKMWIIWTVKIGPKQPQEPPSPRFAKPVSLPVKMSFRASRHRVQSTWSEWRAL